MVQIKRGPINQDGGSTSITHGSQNWNHVQWLPFSLLRPSHTVGSSKPLPPKLFVGQKTLNPIQKRKKKTSTIPTSQKPSTRPPPPRVPIHTYTSSSTSMHGTAYRAGNHLAQRMPPPPSGRQTPPHFATFACRCLSQSTFSTLLGVDPALPGWGICRAKVFSRGQ